MGSVQTTCFVSGFDCSHPWWRSLDEKVGATLGKWVAGSSVEKKRAERKKYCIL
ncbi:hypothetical protein HMPREF0262_00334 [Clostridium sp. ATCC 29733]|nr:hypothetical protein HMPREF0262_00334 [Clostridium sp. ATCC 29733]